VGINTLTVLLTGREMKLNELKLNEGLVDATILMTMRSVASKGLTDDSQVATLAKSLMAVIKGFTFNSTNFNAYFNEFFPTKVVTDELKSLSQEEVKQLASYALGFLEAKNVQLASYGSFKSIGEIIAYATRAEAND
jgi:hypothetical protein